MKAAPWSAEGLTVYTTYRIVKERYGPSYAQEHYVDQWQQAVDNYYLNFYVRNPDYLEALPEEERLEISNSLRYVRQYCEMPLKILKAEQLVGGEEAMDRILRGLFNRELDPMYPYLTYQDFFKRLRADGGGPEPCVKIFLYECKRLLWNKFFAGLVLVLLFYGWQVLRRVTILGVSHTAPFSPWSFGDFLSRMLPLLWIGALFFLTFFTSEKARRAAVLTDAAPLPPRRYALARCAAALTGTALLALACISEAACFYGIYFGWYGWSGLVFPTLVTLVPPLVFALGSGWLLGMLRPWLLYVWMLVSPVCLALPLPESLGLWNGRLFAQYPLTLGTLDPAFTLPAAVLFVQFVLLASGVVLLAVRPEGQRQH